MPERPLMFDEDVVAELLDEEELDEPKDFS
jgi:hypothetical protein